MPELPEVKTVVKYLNVDIKNHKIIDANFLVKKMVQKISPSKMVKIIKGQRIVEVLNKGKFILFKLSNDQYLLSHLRMEGKYRFEKQLNLAKHDHAWFKFKSGYLIYNDVRKFGTFELKTSKELYSTNPLKKLGETPFDLDVKDLKEKLQNKSISIKSALLDQTIVLGLGNIYVDEVLFASKVLPTRKASSLSKSEIKSVLEASKKILDKAIKHDGSSIRTYLAYNKIKGSYQKFLKVHTKASNPCPRCKSKILKTKVNGRGTYYCPKCQK